MRGDRKGEGRVEAWGHLGRCCQGSPVILGLDCADGLSHMLTVWGSPGEARPTGEGQGVQAGQGAAFLPWPGNTWAS